MKNLLITLTSIVAVFALSTVVVYGSTWMNWVGDGQIEQSSNEVAEILSILEQVNEEKLAAERKINEIEDTRPPGLNRQIKELEKQVSELNSNLKAKDKEISELKDELEALKSNQQTNNQVATMSLSQSDVDAEDQSDEENEAKINSLTEANETLEKTVSNLNDDIDQKDKEINSLTESNDSLQISVYNLNEKVLGLEAEVHTQSSLITELNTTIENLNARILSLEAELEAERNSNSSNSNYIYQLEQQLAAANQQIAAHNTFTQEAAQQPGTSVNNGE